MKKLGDIVSAVKDGQRPDYEDLRYAVAALGHLITFDGMALRRLAKEESLGKKPLFGPEHEWEEHFRRVKKAMNSEPKKWLGDNYNIDDPSYHKRRASAIKLFDKFINR